MARLRRWTVRQHRRRTTSASGQQPAARLAHRLLAGAAVPAALAWTSPSVCGLWAARSMLRETADHVSSSRSWSAATMAGTASIAISTILHVSGTGATGVEDGSRNPFHMTSFAKMWMEVPHPLRARPRVQSTARPRVHRTSGLESALLLSGADSQPQEGKLQSRRSITLLGVLDQMIQAAVSALRRFWESMMLPIEGHHPVLMPPRHRQESANMKQHQYQLVASLPARITESPQRCQCSFHPYLLPGSPKSQAQTWQQSRRTPCSQARELLRLPAGTGGRWMSTRHRMTSVLG